jgi:alpha-D-ribose 1-methylphosphonate 5-triphosphate synthase subunit PhnG
VADHHAPAWASQQDKPITSRQAWVGTLAKTSRAKLQGAWEALGDPPAYRLLRGETGLVMLRGRIGGTGSPFNLGEMTMSRAVVQLQGQDDALIGFGYVAGRDVRQAELVALFDAMLQDPKRQDALLRTVVWPLAREHETAKAARAARVAASKVEFFTLVRGE